MTARDRAESTPEAGGEVGEALAEVIGSLRWTDLPNREIAAAVLHALPHLTPQPDGDVRTAVAEVIDRHLRDYPDIEDAHIIADAVLASGLVVPVGEVERYQRWHAEVRAECAGLRAQVAAVRAAVKRGVAGIDLMPTTRAEVSQRWLYDYIATVDQGWRERMLAALDTAPPSPTTDQREGADS